MDAIILSLVNNLAAILMALAAVIASISALWSSLRNAKKIEENTRITVVGVNRASAAAIKADEAVTIAKKSDESLAKAINGRFEQAEAAARLAGYQEGLAEGKASVLPPDSPGKDARPASVTQLRPPPPNQG